MVHRPVAKKKKKKEEENDDEQRHSAHMKAPAPVAVAVGSYMARAVPSSSPSFLPIVSVFHGLDRQRAYCCSCNLPLQADKEAHLACRIRTKIPFLPYDGWCHR